MATATAKDKNVVPQRIVIRHLSGSKAHQVEEYPLDHFKEIKIGRTSTSDVKYDPDADDLVSREHAKIIPDPNDPVLFTIRDLNSRNGILVNKQKVIGMAQVKPDDVIQLGPGGPEFTFDLEPRPDALLRQTRIAESAAMADRPTRASDAPPTTPTPAATTPVVATPTETHRPVGKATVERMVTQTASQSRKYMFIGGALVVVLVVVLVGLFSRRSEQTAQTLGQELGEVTSQMAEEKANQPLTPQQIGTANAGAVVYFEVGWKLIHTQSGQQVFHRYLQQDGQVRAGFIQLDDGSIEPLLTLDDEGGTNWAIGGTHTGSGFVVSNDGFVMTNRHVAASWYTSYNFPPNAFPGILYARGPNGQYQPAGLIEASQMPPWVPAESRMFGYKPISGKLIEGRNDYLDVTFPNNELRIPAQLVRTSNRHDVAMVKIDVPQAQQKVELNDNYDTIARGDEVTVLGYPAISPQVVVGTRSQDVFNRQTQFVVVPDPTLTAGHISRIIRGEQAPTGRTSYEYWSYFGDTYQLDINATGGGNSGGPVFDDRGRVIGIYTATRWMSGTMISFATPVRYGIELMGTQPVL